MDEAELARLARLYEQLIEEEGDGEGDDAGDGDDADAR